MRYFCRYLRYPHSTTDNISTHTRLTNYNGTNPNSFVSPTSFVADSRRADVVVRGESGVPCQTIENANSCTLG